MILLLAILIVWFICGFVPGFYYICHERRDPEFPGWTTALLILFCMALIFGPLFGFMLDWEDTRL